MEGFLFSEVGNYMVPTARIVEQVEDEKGGICLKIEPIGHFGGVPIDGTIFSLLRREADKFDHDNQIGGLEQNRTYRAMRQGFYLALIRYADDLKAVPEAAAMLDSLRRNSAKGAAARRKQAAPTHKAIRSRFRELRKTVPKKTARYLRVADEFEMSDRQIARIVDGID